MRSVRLCLALSGIALVALLQGCNQTSTGENIGPLGISPSSLKLSDNSSSNNNTETVSLTNNSPVSVDFQVYTSSSCSDVFYITDGGVTGYSLDFTLSAGQQTQLVVQVSGSTCSGASLVISHDVPNITNPIYLPITVTN